MVTASIAHHLSKLGFINMNKEGLKGNCGVGLLELLNYSWINFPFLSLRITF